MKRVYNHDYNALYRGIVEDNIDPENLGRCKIRVPAVHGQLNYPVEILPWARPIAPIPTHKYRGAVALPDVGDIVWVLFEGSNKEFPIYVGGTYAKGDMDISPDTVTFYLEDDTTISYDRRKLIYKIRIGKVEFILNEESCRIIGNTSIKGDVSIDGSVSISGDLSVSGTTTLNNLMITGTCNKECDCP